MGKQIYDKPIRLLFKDFADELKVSESFAHQKAVLWFHKKYPKIKTVSVKAHLIRLSTNNPTRVHYNATRQDDLFFQINSKSFRKYDPRKDPAPIYQRDSTKKKQRGRFRTQGVNISDRIKELTDDFDEYLNYFETNIKFSGPSVYFHKKVIDKIRSCNSYEDLVIDTVFIENIYATIASWGMHRMGKNGAKMVDFEPFRESIVLLQSQIINLYKFKLESIPEKRLDRVKDNLSKVFNQITIMASGSSLVGNSKVMHHLLPDLIFPIDRQHTLRFFYNNTNIDKSNESNIFFECFSQFRYIADKIDWSRFPLRSFNTSIPKVIDNAIMGYTMKKLLTKSKAD